MECVWLHHAAVPDETWVGEASCGRAGLEAECTELAR